MSPHGKRQRLLALYHLALLDLQRGHNTKAALKVLVMLERAGLSGVKA